MDEGILRILFVIPGADSGSSMIFARRLLAHVRCRVEAAEAFFLVSRTEPVIIVKEWLRLQRRIREFRPSVVHAQFGTMTGFVTCFSSVVPTVVTFRGSDVNPGVGAPLRSYLGRALSAVTAIRADRVICVSEELRRRLRHFRSFEKISVMPSGVDTSSFRPMDRAYARRLLGWSTDEPVVLFNGSLPKVKRLDLAKRAVEVAQQMLPSQLRFEVLSGGVDGEKIPLLMNAADCLLMTSDYEGSPTVVQEAVACGLPVVSVEVGDVCEILRDVMPSAIVSRDASSLGAAVAGMLANPCRSNGSSIAGAFSFENIADRLINLYTAVAFGAAAVGSGARAGQRT